MSFKKLSAVLLTGNFLFLSACGASGEAGTESVTSVPEISEEQTILSEESSISETEPETILTEEISAPEPETELVSEENAETVSENHILIAYFSNPQTDSTDADSSASRNLNSGTLMGNVEYTASLIQNQIGGDVFRIETVIPYPADYSDTTNQAKNEQNENARPELVSHLENVSQYDTVYLGFPNWWGDMPMAVYSFLEEYDFTGKEIHIFVCHGGSGASGTISSIQSLQSGASVDATPLTLYWTDIENAENFVMNWLN
ncbi:MAG TPA: flavodoxin [Ruminococcus sp.]|nr:flavodoxin [Ruminococcus sp.]